MREILFRGKRMDNGEWVEGWYEPPVEWDGKKFGTTICYICEEGYLEDAEVDPSTVGQYTGLTDKNGKRIFEGDIVRFKWDAECECCHFIEFVDGEFCATPVLPLEGTWSIRIRNENKKFVVVGNIHDNPELLEVCDIDPNECDMWPDPEPTTNADVVERKRGNWNGEADGYADGELVYDVWYCSECNHCIDDGTDDPTMLPNFCPNCGADMRGESDERNDV